MRVHLQSSHSPWLCLSAMCQHIQARKEKQKTKVAQAAAPTVQRPGNAENADPNVSATVVAARCGACAKLFGAGGITTAKVMPSCSHHIHLLHSAIYE